VIKPATRDRLNRSHAPGDTIQNVSARFQAAQGLKSTPARTVRPSSPAPKENTMPREFNPTPRPVRAALAAVALLATLASLGSVEGLARYYDMQAQLASAPPIVVAKH
jgi:hypothetical protein